jgi:hypothetical protein
LSATPEKGGRALGGVGGCGPCAWADAAANNWRDRKNVAAPSILDFMVRPSARTRGCFLAFDQRAQVAACALRFLNQPAGLRNTASREL